MALSFTTSDGGTSYIDDDTLLAWIDETGSEDLKDPNYPLFGLGGCVIDAKRYAAEVQSPWQKIKKDIFGGATSLHATDLKATPDQIAALSKFFDYRGFGRVASILPVSANIAPTLENYETCAYALGLRIAKVSAAFRYNSVVLIVESSERGDPLAEKWLSRISILREYESGRKEEVPMRHFFLPKQLNEPGLEVADFIAHTAGREGRARLRGKESVKDFKHVFHPRNPRLSEFLYITQADSISGEMTPVTTE